MFCSGAMVEVSSVRDETEPAWYPAMMVTELEVDGENRKFLVKDFNQQLSCIGGEASPTNVFDAHLVRPAPPPSTSVEEYELLERVEVLRGSGWSQGLVRKILTEECYLVVLEVTKEECVCKHSQLRPLMVWENGIWRNVSKQKLVKETPSNILNKNPMHSCSGAKPFTRVETVAANVELRKKKKADAVITDIAVTTTTPLIQVRNQISLVNDSIQPKMSEEKNNKSTSSTKRQREQEQHKDMNETGNSSTSSEDRVRKSGQKQKTVKETPKKPMRSSSSGANEKATLHMKKSLNPNHNEENIQADTGGLRKERDDTVLNDKTPLVITPEEVMSIAREYVAPSLVITATPLKQTEAKTVVANTPSLKAPEPVMNLIDFGNDSTPHKTLEEDNSEAKSRKRKREQDQLSNLNEEADENTNNISTAEMNDTTSKHLCHDGEVVDQPLSTWIGNSSTELSSDQILNVMNNNSAVAAAATCTEQTPTKDTLMNLPFTKKSPYWKTYETTESFKSVPQRPHFNTLLEAKTDFFLESAAVGMMVTFYGLLDEVKDLKLDDSTSKLNELSVSFAELEKHGFDVEAPQAAINKVLSLKDVVAKKAEEQKCLEENIQEEESVSLKLKELRAELKLKICELERQDAVAKKKDEAAEKKIAEMKAHTDMISQEIEDVKVEFQKTISASW